MSGSHRHLLAIVAALLLAGLFAWLWRSPDPAETNPGSEASETTNVVATPQSSASDQEPTTTTRDPVAAPTEQPPGPRLDRLLRIRLDGLVPEVPWTEPLRFDLSGRTAAREHHELEDRLTVDAEGVATIELPDWVDELTRTKLRIECRDPNYRPIRHRRREKVEPGELVIPVEDVRVLVGHVVDHRGKPVVAARVTAFPYWNDKIQRPAVGTTTTAQDGSYRVQVHPRLPLAVVAAAMEPMQLSGRSLMGYNGAIAATGLMRTDLLPGWQAVPTPDATNRQATDQRIEDIVLSEAAHIRGEVRWADGTRISGATVQTDASRELWHSRARVQALELSEQSWVYHRDAGHLTTFTSRTTGALGDFEFAVWPGAQRRVEVGDIPETLCDGGIFFDCQQAPSFVDCTVPSAELRAVYRGEPVPHATFELSSGKTRGSNEHGRLRVAPGRLQVRARKGELMSPWHGPNRLTGTSQVVDLALEPRRRRVTVELSDALGSARPPASIEYAWRERKEAETTRTVRRESDSRYRAFVPRRSLRLRVGGGTKGFLIPTWHDLEAGLDPVDIVLTPEYGGRLVLEATKNRLPVPGNFRLTGPGGKPVSGLFWSHVPGKRPDQRMQPGSFWLAGPQTFEHPLPPGTYRLDLTIFPTKETRDFTIRPRETTTVRVRLP